LLASLVTEMAIEPPPPPPRPRPQQQQQQQQQEQQIQNTVTRVDKGHELSGETGEV
jgi:hypothetical protein